ncbi:hypothetical protein ABXT08_06920 [Chryseobacterium sp. NRRL B-14859]|uniref:hypothetical protein n=1 Tax=Chryseobacterium sp. NRRL B-14859 TaxID=1562763 RepID=UPI0033949ACF
MNKLIINIIRFSIPVLLCVGVIESSLRNIPNDYSYKSDYLKENSSKIEVLYVGSSHIFFGVNPEYSQYKAFNAAMTSQDLSLDWKLFNKFKNWNHLKTIVIPIDYISLSSKLENGIEAWRMKNYTLYYGIPSKNITDYAEVFNGRFSDNIGRLQNFYKNRKINIDCNKLGFGTTYSHTIKKDLKNNAAEAAKRHFVDINSKQGIHAYEDNKKAIENFISYGKSKDVKILFVSVPVTSYYSELTNNEQLSTTLSYIKNQVSNNKNCYYINLINDRSFTNNDFYDGDHLNDLGAIKLTLKIDQEIKKHP